MRLVMSKKQTRRPTQKLLKEGWIVHCTDKNDMRKKHYWRLDTKSIVMYQDETSNRYHKEVPLSDILSIRSLLAKPEHGPVSRYFLVRMETTESVNDFLQKSDALVRAENGLRDLLHRRGG